MKIIPSIKMSKNNSNPLSYIHENINNQWFQKPLTLFRLLLYCWTLFTHSNWIPVSVSTNKNFFQQNLQFQRPSHGFVLRKRVQSQAHPAAVSALSVPSECRHVPGQNSANFQFLAGEAWEYYSAEDLRCCQSESDVPVHHRWALIILSIAR